MLRRAATPRPVRPLRTRLGVESLEGRDVPVAVTIAAIADATEGGSSGTFRLTRDSSSGSLGVGVTFSGTAVYGTDFGDGEPVQVVFGNGQTTRDVTIAATNDSTSEATETVVCTISSGGGYTVGSPSAATIGILDNDAQYVSVSKVGDATEGGTDGVFRFTRIGNLASSLTANFTVGGTATSGTDFTSIGTTVSFSAGKATADVSVAAAHDGVYDPDETVSVTVTTGTGYSVGSPSSATVTIADIPDLPVIAFDGLEVTSVNEPIVVSVIDLATDMDGDDFEVSAVTQGESGSVVDNEDGTVTYTPDTDFAGEDTFTYTVEDEFGNEATGTVSVVVQPVVAPPADVWTATNTGVTVDISELAFDPDDDSLSTTAVTQGDHGTVTIGKDGAVTYTPDTSYTGDDEFTYTVEDGDGNEATGTIWVTVGPTDPVALAGFEETEVDTPVNVAVQDLAYQPAGGSLTTTSVTQGTHGSVVIETDGTVTYTPDTAYEGSDTFTYTVTDGSSRTGTGTITVQVGPATSAADDILDDISDMEDEIDNYDPGDPPDLEAAAAAIASGVSDYGEEVTSLISAHDLSIQTRPGIREMIAVGAYLYNLNVMDRLQTQYNALAAMALESKALVEEITQQIKIALQNNNPAQARDFADRYAVANSAHKNVLESIRRTGIALLALDTKVREEYRTIQKSFPGSRYVEELLIPPTAPILSPPDSFIPRP